jgi:hypothetical protein
MNIRKLAILSFLTVALLATPVCTESLMAQSGIPAALSTPTRDTLQHLVDSVRASGLPAEPLIARASEGVLKRVSEERIISAVRTLARRQAEAHAVLPTASAGTLAAAVSALQAGVSPQVLRRLSTAAAGDHELAVGLVTLTDLASARVPVAAAASAVEQLVRRRAAESELMAFRAAVSSDILAGRAAEEAVMARTQALVRDINAQPGRVGERIPMSSRVP